ncbi:PepSY domain-containing protein [Geminicoccus roseus]|uniref:PepSY domain-containing protein n=1 Tax=Geminicoccus roseus TaxID=404900 RepID=UPI0004805185|nr:PepSY domain-containing protein [Geminicoccus roseus]
MRMFLITVAVVGLTAPALAVDPPPQGSKALSELLPSVENRDDFAFIEEIEFEDGAYEIEYNTKDGNENKVKIDSVSGEVTDD